MLRFSWKGCEIKQITSDILMIIFGVFFIAKMHRSFSGSTVAGGVWNYIQILFIVLALFALIGSRRLSVEKASLFLFGFSFLAMLNSLLSLSFDRNTLFNYLMIAYPISVFGIISRDAKKRKIENNPIIDAAFYVITAMYIYFMLRAKSYSTATGAVADVYYILGLLPLLLIHTKKFKLLPCLACGLTILLSGKRAGILLYVLMIIIYYALKSWGTKDIKKGIGSLAAIMLILLLFVVGLYYVSTRYNDVILLKLRIMWYENDSAGRTQRWAKMWADMRNSSFREVVFGHGIGGVSSEFGGNAHNDFLELLYNYGVAPCLCYLGFYISCGFAWVAMIRQKYQYAAEFLMALVFSLGLAMVSVYVIAPTYITCGMMCLGYILVDFRTAQKASAQCLKGENNEACQQ